MRKAVIDLGTNTFNLLIAEVGEESFEVLYTEKEGVALGMGGINYNLIAPEAYRRGVKTIQRFKMICEYNKVEEIKGIGTSALRDASNSDEFIDEVKRKTGITIEIISGHREAELIYQGVKWSYHFSEPAVIMDIGGGSTEFVFADATGINDLISLNIGVSRIYQQFEFSDPLSEKDIQQIEGWLNEKSDGFFDDKMEHTLIGASGSFETFYELVHFEKFPERIKAIEISIDFLKSSLNQIISSTQAERDENRWIIPIRKHMAPIAAVKTRWILKKLDIKKVYISPCSLKEGVLM